MGRQEGDNQRLCAVELRPVEKISAYSGNRVRDGSIGRPALNSLSIGAPSICKCAGAADF